MIVKEQMEWLMKLHCGCHKATPAIIGERE